MGTKISSLPDSRLNPGKELLLDLQKVYSKEIKDFSGAGVLVLVLAQEVAMLTAEVAKLENRITELESEI